MKHEWLTSLEGFGIGIPIAVAGLIFAFRKDWLTVEPRGWVKSQAVRFWPALIVLLFVWIVGPNIYQRATGLNAAEYSTENKQTSSTESDKSPWSPDYKPVVLTGKSFKNVRILLDGFSYENCIFEDVTFVYNGTTPIRINNPTINGTWGIASDKSTVVANSVDLTAFLIKIKSSDAITGTGFQTKDQNVGCGGEIDVTNSDIAGGRTGFDIHTCSKIIIDKTKIHDNETGIQVH